MLAGQPAGSDGADKLLFGDRSSTNQNRLIEDPVVGEDGFAAGAKKFYSVDPATGQAVPVDLSGAGQGKIADGSRAAIREAFRTGRITREQARSLLAPQPAQ